VSDENIAIQSQQIAHIKFVDEFINGGDIAGKVLGFGCHLLNSN
jgi:hypothetical protein